MFLLQGWWRFLLFSHVLSSVDHLQWGQWPGWCRYIELYTDKRRDGLLSFLGCLHPVGVRPCSYFPSSSLAVSGETQGLFYRILFLLCFIFQLKLVYQTHGCWALPPAHLSMKQPQVIFITLMSNLTSLCLAQCSLQNLLSSCRILCQPPSYT